MTAAARRAAEAIQSGGLSATSPVRSAHAGVRQVTLEVMAAIIDAEFAPLVEAAQTLINRWGHGATGDAKVALREALARVKGEPKEGA